MKNLGPLEKKIKDLKSKNKKIEDADAKKYKDLDDKIRPVLTKNAVVEDLLTQLSSAANNGNLSVYSVGRLIATLVGFASVIDRYLSTYDQIVAEHTTPTGLRKKELATAISILMIAMLPDTPQLYTRSSKITTKDYVTEMKTRLPALITELKSLVPAK